MSIVHITDDTFENEVIKSATPVLVDFWAEWCGPCKMIAPILEQLATEYKDRLRIAKVDVDSNQATAMRYAIRSIPTLLLFKGGAVQAQQGGVMALGKYRDFEVDSVFFSLRRKEGVPLGSFGRLRVGENNSVLLYAFPYLRSVSPLWYSLAPAPLGVVVFLKDEMTGALESLMAVSEYTRGASARVVLAVMGKAFTEFGLGENTIRLFRNRVERLGCTMKIREMEQLTAEEIRDSLSAVIRQQLEVDTA